jgi:hypothetical protein
MDFIKKYFIMSKSSKLSTITPSHITYEEQIKKFTQKKKEKETKLLYDMKMLKINHKTL